MDDSTDSVVVWHTHYVRSSIRHLLASSSTRGGLREFLLKLSSWTFEVENNDVLTQYGGITLVSSLPTYVYLLGIESR